MNKQIVGKQLGISDAWWHEINELKNKVFVILERIEHIIGIVWNTNLSSFFSKTPFDQLFCVLLKSFMLI